MEKNSGFKQSLVQPVSPKEALTAGRGREGRWWREEASHDNEGDQTVKKQSRGKSSPARCELQNKHNLKSADKGFFQQ